MAPVLVAHAFRISAVAAVVAITALSGRSAVAQSRPDLDALVYGQQPAPVQQPATAQQPMPQPVYVQPSASTTSSGGAIAALRSAFGSRRAFISARANARPHNDLDSLAYAQPVVVSPQGYRPGLLTSPANPGGLVGMLRSAPRRTYAPAHVVYAAPAPLVVYDPAYRLDAGDRLRVVVYGQEGLTNSYAVDAGGSITMPLIGAVSARGRTPSQLAAAITARLRDGYIREPYVAAEVEAYRPFFILGEVAAPGQYPFVPNMSVESAVAIAGGFSPRAKRDRVTITHTDARGTIRATVPLGTPLNPGDTVVVGERWF